MLSVFSSLFINASIIVSTVLLAHILLQDPRFILFKTKQLAAGFFAGVLGSILILYSIPINEKILLDLRYFPILFMALYSSMTAAVFAAVLIGLFRILIQGVSDVSLLAAGITLAIGIGSGWIGRLPLHLARKWVAVISLTCALTGSTVWYLLRANSERTSILTLYLGAIIAMAFLMYAFLTYITSVNRKLELLREEAEKDFLTGLKNPRQFYKSLNHYFKVTMENDRKVSLLYLDVDHFKAVNDTFGHADGDLVLQELGKILKRATRSHDIVSRKGGEEFAALLVDCNLEQAVIAAERIRRNVESYDFKLRNQLSTHITVSIGVSAIPEKTQEISKLLEQADCALYAAKNSGRNRVEIA
ncbi:MAG: GGDEF domain-containing protein [Clostridia bacterium]|nr:GGDEF domain-containing protein [Clostridia bacterium]